jgi:Fur family iron response transcriptional regulator
MPTAGESDCREELRRAGLSSHRPLVRLLALLRAAEGTHLGLAEVVRMAAESGLAPTPVGLARQLQILVDHGLLGRLPTTAAEPVFDTDPRQHSHLVYEETGEIVDLHVSPETLFAILRQALAEWPEGVEILVRIRANRTPGRRH